jgi:hypothetical protein
MDIVRTGRYGIWIGCHAIAPLLLWAVVALLSKVPWVGNSTGPRLSDLLFYLLPGLALGLMQWVILTRWYRPCSLWWLPSTAVGTVASILFVWWFMLAPGLTIGLAQYGFLKMRWRRFASLWVPASGLGWAAGFIGGATLGEDMPSGFLRDILPVSFGAASYGVATALVLHVLVLLNPLGFPGQGVCDPTVRSR